MEKKDEVAVLQLADVLLSYTYGSIYRIYGILAEGPLIIFSLQYLEICSFLTLNEQYSKPPFVVL